MRINKPFSRVAGSSVARALGAGSALAAVALALAGPVAVAQDGPVPATWQQHRKTFNYIGISPTYSCVGLQDALTYLLQHSGAKLNRPVTAYPCIGGGGPSTLPSANLDFSTLQAAQGGGGSGNVDGVWRHVEFSMTRSNPQLHGSDCELVQEFKDNVLPMFTTRNVTSNLHCIPHQTIGNQFDLSFDVLAPAKQGHHGGED
ncbi:MAG TPA: hypothetical protein VMF64_03520 [Steroidobacteraceae bacterium]|nr:hypothetical protein [Steroidobacteraceae bacterium]